MLQNLTPVFGNLTRGKRVQALAREQFHMTRIPVTVAN